MQISKWGNSLAIRLPAQVVEALGLKEGDEIDIRIASKRMPDIERERALKRIAALRKPLPAGWRIDRDEANAR